MSQSPSSSHSSAVTVTPAVVHFPSPPSDWPSDDDGFTIDPHWIRGRYVANPSQVIAGRYVEHVSEEGDSSEDGRLVHTESMSETLFEPSTPGTFNSPSPAPAFPASPVIHWSPSPSQSRAPSTVPSPSPSTVHPLSSRASSVGPIRRGRGEIRAGEDSIDDMQTIDTARQGFRFNGRTYFCTWSQVGERPNSLLEEKMDSFGNRLKGISH